MPSVFTIEGAPRSKRKTKCKRVTNKKTGCSIELCHVGKSKNCPTGWSFTAGTSRCPTGRRRKR